MDSEWKGGVSNNEKSWKCKTKKGQRVCVCVLFLFDQEQNNL